MGMHTHASAFCRLSSTLHLPNAYGPPPSTLHQFFHLFTINQLWPMLPMSYACSTVAWGCNDRAPRAWKEISSRPDLGSTYVLAPQSLGHGFIKSFLGS